MSFFYELIESFVPTVAFAEEPVEEVVEETPVEETPVEETPVEETPSEETPVDETPSEETPSEKSPSEEEAPAEEEEAAEEAADDEEEEEDEDEDDEDDEEEEEGGDPLDKLKSECAELPSIKPFLHHYEHCVERVTKAQEEPGYDDLHYKEDCIEEFFHLQHHLNDCIAPRLFAKLK